MTPQATAELVLALLRGAKMIAGLLSVADLEEVTPELRAELHAERDKVNADFSALMPKEG